MSKSSTQRSRVAILMDFDNMGSGLDLENLRTQALTMGEIVLAASFADIGSVMTNEQITEMYISGFLMIHCPKRLSTSNQTKDCVDQILQSFMIGIITNMDVDTVLLATIDRDFTPAITHLQNKGIKVIVVSRKDRLKDACVVERAVDEMLVCANRFKEDILVESATTGQTLLTEIQTFVALQVIADLVTDRKGKVSKVHLAEEVLKATEVSMEKAEQFIRLQISSGYVGYRPTDKKDRKGEFIYRCELLGKPPQR